MINEEKFPLLSVVMGCYNNENTISDSINSILNQTFSDFEFIIIDDCSTDNTVSIIKSFNDKRINLIINDTNKGLGFSLNLGVNLSRGKYIARMDADDISVLSRFQKQINYLEHHPNIICLGTGAKKIGCISLFAKLFSPNIIPACNYDKIKACLLMGTPFLHPSVMMNADLLKKYGLNYDPKFRRAQDYELWTRMIWMGKVANIRTKLIYYRYSPQQASNIHADEQAILSKTMYNRMFYRLLGRPLSDEEVKTHTLFVRKSKLSSKEFLKVKLWLKYLYPYIIKSDQFDKEVVIDLFSRRWCVVCRNHSNLFMRFVEYLSDKHYCKYKYILYLFKI